MGGCSHSITAPLCFSPPHTFPLLQHGAFLRAAVFQDKPASVWALHRLQFRQGVSTVSSTGFSTSCSVDILTKVSYTFMKISWLNLSFFVEIKLMVQAHLMRCQETFDY